MPTLCKSVVLGAAFLGGIVIAANADPLCRTGAASCQLPSRKLATLPPANSAPSPGSVTLPKAPERARRLDKLTLLVSATRRISA
jgi:hypothetical protein